MRALVVKPGVANSATLRDVAEPDPACGAVLVQGMAIGVCGTDREIVAGNYGWAPPGEDRLILGHESLGRVVNAPESSDLSPGDFVVGIVRMPDPAPCLNCAAGEWDMCCNGRYTEHGIKQLHGFGSEQWRVPVGHAVKVDPKLGDLGVLLEPASILAKAWEQIERIGGRARWRPVRVLVTGAGPVGLLAALMGRQRGLDVDVLDIVTEGPKPALVGDLGATYHTGRVQDIGREADIVIECTGIGQLVLDVMQGNRRNAIVCLTGISSGRRTIPIDAAAINKEMVLENDVVFGSVNANRRHYESAAKSLASADPNWLRRLITRRVPMSRWAEALHRETMDVKTVIDLAG